MMCAFISVKFSVAPLPNSFLEKNQFRFPDVRVSVGNFIQIYLVWELTLDQTESAVDHVPEGEALRMDTERAGAAAAYGEKMQQVSEKTTVRTGVWPRPRTAAGEPCVRRCDDWFSETYARSAEAENPQSGGKRSVAMVNNEPAGLTRTEEAAADDRREKQL